MPGRMSWRDKAAYQSERMLKNFLSLFLSIGILLVFLGIKITACFKRKPVVPVVSSNRIVELKEPLLDEPNGTELTEIQVDKDSSQVSSTVTTSSTTGSLLLVSTVTDKQFSDEPLPPSSPYESIPIPVRKKREIPSHPDCLMFNAIVRYLQQDRSFVGLERIINHFAGEAARRTICPPLVYIKTVSSLTISSMVFLWLLHNEPPYLPREAQNLKYYSIFGVLNAALTVFFTPEEISSAIVDNLFEGPTGVAAFVYALQKNGVVMGNAATGLAFTGSALMALFLSIESFRRKSFNSERYLPDLPGKTQSIIARSVDFFSSTIKTILIVAPTAADFVSTTLSLFNLGADTDSTPEYLPLLLGLLLGAAVVTGVQTADHLVRKKYAEAIKMTSTILTRPSSLSKQEKSAANIRGVVAAIDEQGMLSAQMLRFSAELLLLADKKTILSHGDFFPSQKALLLFLSTLTGGIGAFIAARKTKKETIACLEEAQAMLSVYGEFQNSEFYNIRLASSSEEDANPHRSIQMVA